eukprot:scaffold8621_cov91-Cylindrotheca_fusiformis.AAC.1
MTDVTSVYVTLNDEDDECFEVCSEEESSFSEHSCTGGKTPLRPQQPQSINVNSQTECFVPPDLVETSNSNSVEDELFTASAEEDYSSAFVLELPRIQPTVRYGIQHHTYSYVSPASAFSSPIFSGTNNSDLTCFLDILSFSKLNKEEDEEPKKKKGSRIVKNITYSHRQGINARGNIVPQESSWTRKKNYKPRTTSETIRRSEQEEQTSVLPLSTGEERKPKRCNSLSSVASTPSTTCHYLAKSVKERRLSISSATTSTNLTPSRNNVKTKKSVDAAASCAVSTTSAARRPSARARRSRPIKGDKHH